MRLPAALLLLLAPALGQPADLSLANRKIRLAFSPDGRLTELTNLSAGQNYAGGKPVWEMFYRQQDSFENEVSAEASRPTVTRQGDELVLRYDSLQSPRGALAVGLEMRARLVEDEVRWSLTLANRQPEIVITEIAFPLVGACRFRPDQELIWSYLGGERFDSILATVQRRRTEYYSSDQDGLRMSIRYPGGAATNSFVLAGAAEGLYFGSHDPTFQATLHSLRARGRDLDVGMIKYPFLATGGVYRADGFVTSPYSGSWRVAARKYRAWADTWLARIHRVDWVASELAGWQRVTVKHQYGKLMHPYSELPGVVADGLSAGIPGLLVFGWWNSGMDQQYTNYVCDERQGGCAALRDAFRASRARGGRILQYFHGWGVDVNTEYYRREGHRISIKDSSGREPEFTSIWGGAGTAVKEFRGRHVVQACASAPEWTAMLRRFADEAASFGADSLFLDSTGYWENPCWDPNHGHPTPFTTGAKARAEQLRQVREHMQARHPQMALGMEIPNDVVSQYVDYVHGMTGGTALAGAARPGVKPKSTGFLDWFRYIFPEIILSDRNIYDDTDVKRRVNHMLLLGLRSDVAVYRVRGTIRDAPLYRDYTGKATSLMKKHAAFLMTGAYCDADHFTHSNAEVEARGFTSGRRLAVVLTQSHLARASTELKAEGYRMTGHDGIGEYTVEPDGGAARVGLARDALALVIFDRL
jgi:hypothetical protein